MFAVLACCSSHWPPATLLVQIHGDSILGTVQAISDFSLLCRALTPSGPASSGPTSSGPISSGPTSSQPLVNTASISSTSSTVYKCWVYCSRFCPLLTLQGCSHCGADKENNCILKLPFPSAEMIHAVPTPNFVIACCSFHRLYAVGSNVTCGFRSEVQHNPVWIPRHVNFCADMGWWVADHPAEDCGDTAGDAQLDTQ